MIVEALGGEEPTPTPTSPSTTTSASTTASTSASTAASTSAATTTTTTSAIGPTHSSTGGAPAPYRPPGPGPGQGTLAATGVPGQVLLPLGALLVGVGSALFMLARIRQATRHRGA